MISFSRVYIALCALCASADLALSELISLHLIGTAAVGTSLCLSKALYPELVNYGGVRRPKGSFHQGAYHAFGGALIRRFESWNLNRRLLA